MRKPFEITVEEFAPASDRPKSLKPKTIYHVVDLRTGDHVNGEFHNMYDAVRAARALMETSRKEIPVEVKVRYGVV